MQVDLTPDAIGLRARFRGLMLHLHNVAEPVFWDLSGKNPDFIKTFPCLGVPQRICITAYGITADNALHLVFRNWGSPQDGLKLFPEPMQ
jgi:hypothetical protein